MTSFSNRPFAPSCAMAQSSASHDCPCVKSSLISQGSSTVPAVVISSVHNLLSLLLSLNYTVPPDTHVFDRTVRTRLLLQQIALDLRRRENIFSGIWSAKRKANSASFYGVKASLGDATACCSSFSTASADLRISSSFFVTGAWGATLEFPAVVVSLSCTVYILVKISQT